MSSTSRIPGLSWFGTIRGRLAGVIALFALAMIALVAFQAWRGVGEIYAARQEQLRNVVEVAVKAIEGQYNAFKAGKISEAEAQERAKSILRAMRYNETGYLFAQDDNIITIVHGARPDQEGVDGRGAKDSNGKYLSLEMHKVASEQGQGYVDYMYAKPNAPLDQPSPKLSFVKFFAPWRWTVGTGVYIDDLNAKVWSQVLLSSAAALGCILIIGGIAGAFVLKLSNRLNVLGSAMTRLAAGDNEASVPVAAGHDEVDAMTAAVHVFQDAARARARLEANAESTRKEAETSRVLFDAERAERERKLEEATNALGLGLERLAGGDLAYRIETPFETRLDKLRLDFNSALEKLRQTIIAVRENADGLKVGVEEIARASDNLSARTEQQAASLEETATALDEITSQLKSAAQGAKDASMLVATADNDAKESAVVVKRAVDAMAAISNSSQQITQIIGVIDEIAFQTNLLALNAGVEAARAGDAGRGFAVVASEVRALAQRSADAAKEIKTLIAASSAQVETGVELVTDTGGGLERIISKVSEINSVVAAISEGAQQQATGMQQVNIAINEMDHATQQNATMAEQSNAASRSLTQETTRLAELIGQFNLGASGKAPDLRRELQKAAPHAFKAPPAPPGRTAKKPALAAKAANDWSEF